MDADWLPVNATLTAALAVSVPVETNDCTPDSARVDVTAFVIDDVLNVDCTPDNARDSADVLTTKPTLLVA